MDFLVEEVSTPEVQVNLGAEIFGQGQFIASLYIKHSIHPPICQILQQTSWFLLATQIQP